MNKLLTMMLFAALTLVLAPSVDAAVRTFMASITSDQEVPGIPSEGSSGIGTFILNDDNPASPFLSYDITLTGLDLDGLQTPGDPNDNVTRTHFHAQSFGVNGGIVFGQIDPSATLRNDLDDLVVNNALGTINGVWDNAEGNGTTLAAQILAGVFNLDANNRTGIYFNVHTADHGGGEIRGQLTLIPEPATLALVSLGAIMFSGVMRRRR